MSYIKLSNYSESPSTPESGKTIIFAASGGRLATRDDAGVIREMSAVGDPSDQTLVYGVRYDTVNDIVEPGILVSGVWVATDYQDYPVQEQMARGLLTTGNVFSPLNPFDSYYLDNGVAATLSGASGQVMVRIPRFYYRIYRSGNYVYYLLSLSAFAGAVVHPAFRDQAYRYCSAFEGVLYDVSAGGVVADGGGGSGTADTGADKLYSVPGSKPYTYQTRAMYRSLCTNNGGGYHQYDDSMHEMLMLLFLTRYKSFNSQSVLPGYTEKGSWDFAYTQNTGLTLRMGNACGSIYDGSLCIANSFYGIENIFGHIWKWADGINVSWAGDPLLGRIYTCNDPDGFADDTTTGYTDTGLDLPSSSGYVSALHDGTFYASSTTGGSSSTFLTDYAYASSAAVWCGVLVGGTLSAGAPAGFGFRYANYAASYRSSSFGGRLAA